MNLVTKLVLKLEYEPKGYNVKIAPGCKITIRKANLHGALVLDNDKTNIVGYYTNLRRAGKVVLANVQLNEHIPETYMGYAVYGFIAEKNHIGEVTHLVLEGVSANVKKETNTVTNATSSPQICQG